MTHDQVKESIGNEFRKSLIGTYYGINVKPRTLVNPMSNAILEQIHQVLGNLVRTFNIQKSTLMKITRRQAFWLQQYLQFAQQQVGKKVIVRAN